MMAMVRRPATQKGAALLLAMVILTLVTTLAAGMIWQQWRAVAVESAERARAQITWVLTGGLDLGRLILRLDARTPGVDHLGEPWALKVEESSLGSLLAQDRNHSAEGAPEAFLLGSIRDAQSRYNLRNLVDGSQKIVEAELRTLTRLCETAGVAPETAGGIAAGLLAAWQAGNAIDSEASGLAPLAPKRIEQLVWLGLDADTVRRLTPYVELLPDATPLNINTALPEVLAAVIDDMDASSAERLHARAIKTAFKTVEDARTYIPGTKPLDPRRLSVSSNYFEIYGRVRMDGRAVEERWLVVRRDREIVPLMRTRQSVPAVAR